MSYDKAIKYLVANKTFYPAMVSPLIKCIQSSKKNEDIFIAFP